MGEYSYLMIGTEDSEEAALCWKYDDCPWILSILFEPNEKLVCLNVGTDDEGEQFRWTIFRFETTAGLAWHRLSARGLDYDRVMRLGAEASAMTPAEFKRVMVNKSRRDPELVFEELDSLGHREVVELVILWYHLKTSKETTSVVFDGTETAYGNPHAILERDHIGDAQGALVRRLHAVSGLLDFVRAPSPEALQYVASRMRTMPEAKFLDKIVVPVMEAEGYTNVKVIDHHGPDEFGNDLRPMRKLDLGKWFYVGAQAKTERITQDEAPHVWSQLDTALTVSFSDDADNVSKRLDSMFLLLGGGATGPAMKYLTGKASARPVRILDAGDIARLVLKHDLVGHLS